MNLLPLSKHFPVKVEPYLPANFTISPAMLKSDFKKINRQLY